MDPATQSEREEKKEDERARVNFHYIKSSDFRVMHCDGVWGGITPQGQININLFAERGPIPKRLTHEITEQGGVGEELTEERIVRDGIIREVQMGAIMNLATAKAVLAWLEDKVQILDKVAQEAEAEK